MKVQVADIVWVDLNPTLGDEKNKLRPCVVLQEQITPLKLVTVLPITDDNGKRRSVFYVSIPHFKMAGLKKKSVIDCYQIRNLSLQRVIQISGKVDESVMDQVRASVALILGIQSRHIDILE